MISTLIKHKLLLLVLGTGIGFSIISCKKSEVVDPIVVPPVVPGATDSRANLSKDSIFLYAKQVYLWNDALPTYEVFNPRKYTSGSTDLDNYDAVLFAITQYKVDTQTGLPYEFAGLGANYAKYSYIDDISTRNDAQAYVSREKADVELSGSGYDLGILTFQGYGTNTSYELYASAIFPGSPAALAGLTRGTKITKINGTNIGTNFNGESDLIYSLVEAETTSATLSGVKADGTAFTDVVLKKVRYTSSPVYKHKTITAGAKKIGYLAFARFSELNSNAKKDLDAAFAQFATDGVTDLIVDLRYNGGGYVNTAEYLINLIAPSTATGVMFSEHYNATMQANKATILANQPLLDENDKLQYQNGKMVTYADIDYSVAENTVNFSKVGNVGGVTKVVFLVSGNTASSSELVINSLKPVMTVKLVGKKTYGKPVGFFPVRLENKYDVYLSMFETKNKLDQGGYFAGMTPDVLDTDTRTVFDDSTHDFGDPEESYTKNAIDILAPGVAVTSAKSVMSIRGKKVAVSSALGLLDKGRPINQFIGMVETRHQFKK